MMILNHEKIKHVSKRMELMLKGYFTGIFYTVYWDILENRQVDRTFQLV